MEESLGGAKIAGDSYEGKAAHEPLVVGNFKF